MASYKSGASKVVLPRYANHSSLNVDYFNTPTERLGELRTDPEYYNYSTEYFRSRYSFSSDPADDYTQYGGQQIGALLGQHSDPSGYPRLAVRDDDIYLPGREYHYMKPVPQQYPVAEISQVSPVPQYPYYPSYVQPPKVQYYWNPAYTVLPVGYHGGPVVTSQPYGFRPPSYGRGRAADDSSTCADSDASTIYRKERAGAWLSRGCCWWLFFIFVFLVGAAALGGIGYGIYLAVQSPKVREYEYSGVAILPGVPYKDEYKFLRDPVTRQFSDNFCKKILSTMQKSSLRDSYRGCEVTLLEKEEPRGSTKVHFTLNFTRQPAGDGGCEVVIQEDSCDRSQDIRDMLYNEAQGGTAFKEYGSGVISWSIQPKILVGKSTTADPSILMSSMASRSSTNAKMTTAERVKQTTIAPEVTNPITAVPAQSTEVIVTTGIVETGTEKLNTESELQTTDAGQSTAGPPNTSGSALTAVYLTTETFVSGSAAFTPGSTIEEK